MSGRELPSASLTQPGIATAQIQNNPEHSAGEGDALGDLIPGGFSAKLLVWSCKQSKEQANSFNPRTVANINPGWGMGKEAVHRDPSFCPPS